MTTLAESIEAKLRGTIRVQLEKLTALRARNAELEQKCAHLVTLMNQYLPGLISKDEFISEVIKILDPGETLMQEIADIGQEIGT